MLHTYEIPSANLPLQEQLEVVRRTREQLNVRLSAYELCSHMSKRKIKKMVEEEYAHIESVGQLERQYEFAVKEREQAERLQ